MKSACDLIGITGESPAPLDLAPLDPAEVAPPEPETLPEGPTFEDALAWPPRPPDPVPPEPPDELPEPDDPSLPEEELPEFVFGTGCPPTSVFGFAAASAARAAWNPVFSGALKGEEKRSNNQNPV